MVRKIGYLAVLAVMIFLVYNLSQQIYQSLRAGSRMDREAEELSGLQKKNAELKQRLFEVETLQFIEKEARDKLNLSRPNETVVVIPEDEINKVLESWQEKKIVEVPNWQGWLKLFWH